MARKHAILLVIIVSVLLLVVAMLYYPGGSRIDKNSVGFDWKNNYFSNLFGKTALNGSNNPSRLWAIAGTFFLSISFALFFTEFSKRIPLKSSARVIKYFGIAAMISTFLAVTPYHDLMITISCTLVLISIFYISVYVFKSKLHFFKIVCILCLLALYSSIYVYYTGNFVEFLPIMQKVDFAMTIIWMLSLLYFTGVNDFKPVEKLSR